MCGAAGGAGAWSRLIPGAASNARSRQPALTARSEPELPSSRHLTVNRSSARGPAPRFCCGENCVLCRES